jgi:glycosyltransferase involved in cell wall biosynthesis
VNSDQPKLSLVIPCYNEGKVLPLLCARLVQSLATLGISWEAILVDDGSQDDTFEQLTAMHQGEPRFKAISFSRNFGHQTAVFAGLCHTSGEIVAVMDADLQDPPEFLAMGLAKLKEGYDVVYAVRRQRKEIWFKRVCYAVFYRMLKLISEVEIPLDSGDFCLMRQRVVSVLRQMPERNVFVRGLRAWSGFRQIGIEYNRDARAAGETKYPYAKVVAAGDGWSVCLLAAPIKAGNLLGVCESGFVAGRRCLFACLESFGFPGARAPPGGGAGLDFNDLPVAFHGWNAISHFRDHGRIYRAHLQ